jgi:hypothetical protein
MNRALIGALCALFLVPGLRLASGQGNAQEQNADKIAVEVWAIRATTTNKIISPELKDLAKKLHKDAEFKKYTGFKLESRATGKTEPGRGYSVELLEQYRATVTPREREKKNIKLQFEAERQGKPILNTTISAPVGSLVPFGVGPLSNEDFLITAVRAR